MILVMTHYRLAGFQAQKNPAHLTPHTSWQEKRYEQITVKTFSKTHAYYGPNALEL